MSNPYTLYGMSVSLYTGKVRAYLIHHGIDYIERTAGHPTFTQEIVPQIGRWIIPVLVTPDGDILQDGTDIIDHFDKNNLGRHRLHPDEAVLAAVSYLFELFGGEGLLRAAMHYRWNFDADNLDFLRTNFSEAFPPNLPTEQQAALFAHSSGRMRKAGAMFGVSEHTAPTIEASLCEFLTLFDTHLAAHDFLLGGRPTVGDYGLMNGLFAHLARDPHPSAIMKKTAPRVFAWCERMNRPSHTQGHDLIQTIPTSLTDMMGFVAVDLLPEMTAHTHFTNQWLDKNNVDENSPLDRSLGMADIHWRDHAIKTAVMPYRTWLTQRLTDHFDQSRLEDQTSIQTLFDQTGLTDLLTIRVSRRVERRDNREYWGEPQNETR